METKEEYIEGNKLIAEFMGGDLINDAPEDYPNGYYIWKGDFETDYSQLEDFEFHENWNWLMEVVEKIESLTQYVKIVQNVCIIGSSDIRATASKPTVSIASDYQGDNTKISNTFKAVTQWIKYYNGTLRDNT